jgi:hypothetical protein
MFLRGDCFTSISPTQIQLLRGELNLFTDVYQSLIHCLEHGGAQYGLTGEQTDPLCYLKKTSGKGGLLNLINKFLEAQLSL